MSPKTSIRTIRYELIRYLPFQVIRYLLVRANKELDRALELDLKGTGRQRLEEAARLEGISFDEAVRRKKGFRYLV